MIIACRASVLIVLLGVCASCAGPSLKGRTIANSSALPANEQVETPVDANDQTIPPQSEVATPAADPLKATPTGTTTTTETTKTKTPAADTTSVGSGAPANDPTTTASNATAVATTPTTTTTATNSITKASGSITAGSGIGAAAIDFSSLTISGQTLKQCNQTGKTWVPQFVGNAVNASCKEPLAAIACNKETIAAYYKKLGLASQYEASVAKIPDFTLYNCGLKDHMLIMHWLNISPTGLKYSEMGVIYL